MNPTTGYDADSIQTLEGLEAVRKRPGMYIGGTGSDGLMHLVWEIIDNGVDEAAGGHANRIDVTLHRDRIIEVTDNGRGIPIDLHAKRKVSALEVVFTELHAGGKFGGGAYGSSGGLHGVGASVVNALAAKLVAEVDRNGATWRLAFKERVAGRFDGSRFRKTHELEKVKKISKNKTGTRIRFLPDFEIFDPEATIDFETVCERVTRACFLVPGLRITVTDKRSGTDNEPFEFVSRGGLADLVDEASIGDPVTKIIHINGIDTFEEKVPVHGKMTLVERDVTVDIALRWVKGFDTHVSSFVNTIPTAEGGTHLAGFERALTTRRQRRAAGQHPQAGQAGQAGQGPRQQGGHPGGPGRRGQGHAARAAVPRSDQTRARHAAGPEHRLRDRRRRAWSTGSRRTDPRAT